VSAFPTARAVIAFTAFSVLAYGLSARAEEPEKIDSKACATCHETGAMKTKIADDVAHSIHEALACQDCHSDKTTVPHATGGKAFLAGREGCRSCHDKESAEYVAHGRAAVGSNVDMPHCSSCHGGHDVLPSSVQRSRTNPSNLPTTCGTCHENLDLTSKYNILINTPVQIYNTSVHGRATRGGVYLAASCADCHSAGGSAHKILGPGDPNSSINHFNIPTTCGKCHKGVASDYLLGIHGQRAAQGETDVPVCTTCHGEHGIISPSDPRSPVSRSRVAEATCAPCHESALLNEKYGLPAGRLASFIDSYHGLKSKAGDTHVANCASCHGVHRILPSSDPGSTVNAANLQKTCGECHPRISARLAAAPIHGVRGAGLRTRAADVVERIYVVAIVLIIGLMVVHWLLDLYRQIRKLMERRPQVIRMMPGEVWQHTFLMVSFIVLVISGFALRFSDSWIAGFFFGWEGGFGLRGTVHRVAATVFALTVAWHVVYLFTGRGRRFAADMMPAWEDFAFFWDRILHNLGRAAHPSSIQRFSYVEKAEYWALVWGTAVMIVTGIVLWFDNWFIHYLPKGVLDVALVVHYWEAWLATLAIAVWHLYSTVFNPHVYPMNPSWITGTMPEDMYRHEHPGHLDAARRETSELIRKQAEKVGPAPEGDSNPQP
jgi:cytochrome b subunit of formate dehydrogenase